MSSANNTQVGGTHYRTGIQHWDFVANRRLGYFEGQVTKYVSRWRKKNGAQDLEKAAHFLDKLIELTAAGWVLHRLAPPPGQTLVTVAAYGESNALTPDEQLAIAFVVDWSTLDDLCAARRILAELIATAKRADDDAAGPGPGYVNQG